MARSKPDSIEFSLNFLYTTPLCGACFARPPLRTELLSLRNPPVAQQKMGSALLLVERSAARHLALSGALQC